ncbi:MAG: T9SS type A sorting domain-containing protein [Bacteroidales bacterium]|nr:T9SS type A sorting domain-containing protein [Bacteroidales bacterium]
MKNIRFIFLTLALSAVFVSVNSQNYHVRIGTIGNSITHGISLPDPATQAYPIQLGVMLQDVYGDTCIVQNFGLTTTTMLKNGDVSYWDTQHLQDYLAWAPEICFILLGTNDTKPQNWDVYGNEFIDDYLAMIDTILLRNPSTKFMLGYPPPAFEEEWGIRDSIIVNGIIPAIDSVLKLREAELVDFYHTLLDSAYLFPDHIHPNVEGSAAMAKLILDKMTETDIVHKVDTGLTFITSFKTEDSPIPVGDSTSLSWTTINADSVYLNGELVSANNNMKISPPATTVYTLVAYGQKSNDTLQLTQEMYVPELSRLRIYPEVDRKYVGDTTFFQVFYHDQEENLMTSVYFSVQWTVEGTGILFDATDTSVFHIAENADTSYLVVSYEELSDQAMIIGRAVTTGIPENTNRSEVIVFPNPCNEVMYIQFASDGNPVSVEVIDMKGVLLLHETATATKAEKGIYSINISHLPEGSYFLTIKNSGKVFTDKIVILKK